MNEAFIVGSGDGRYLDLGNFEALVLASAAQTSSEFTLLQVQGEPPEFGPPLHLHRDTAEALYVLEGEYLMYVDDRQQLCRPAPSCMYPETPRTPSKWSPPYPARSWFSSHQLRCWHILRSWPLRKRPEMPHRSCWMPSPPGTTWRCSGRCQTPISKPEQRAKSRYADQRARRGFSS